MKKKLTAWITILMLVVILTGCTVSGTGSVSASPNTGGNTNTSPAITGGTDGAGDTSPVPGGTGGQNGTGTGGTGGTGGNVQTSPEGSPSPSPKAS